MQGRTPVCSRPSESLNLISQSSQRRSAGTPRGGGRCAHSGGYGHSRLENARVQVYRSWRSSSVRSRAPRLNMASSSCSRSSRRCASIIRRTRSGIDWIRPAARASAFRTSWDITVRIPLSTASGEEVRCRRSGREEWLDDRRPHRRGPDLGAEAHGGSSAINR